MITKVTITGADDSIKPEQLLELTRKFPFVEWGILLSRSNIGSLRFPSHRWIEQLKEIKEANPDIKLSAHFCGSYVREFLTGDTNFIVNGVGSFWPIFDRIQINTHGMKHFAAPDAVYDFINNSTKQYIFQYDNENTVFFETLAKTDLKNISALFDLSHGTGVLPGEWPMPLTYAPCGYAGGLGPDNLETQINLIESKVGETEIWIDMETRVRSNNDALFDLNKVSKCLEISSRFINQ